MRGVTDKSETAHDRIEDMAADYLREIRKHQPYGPYRLCGASFGGLVAYEAAMQLRNVGEIVSLLALIDTYAPGYGAEQRSRTGRGNHIRGLIGKAKFNLFYINELPTRREQMNHVVGRLRAMRIRLRRKATWKANEIAIEYNKATGKDLPNDMLRNVNAIKKAERAYIPLSYDGKIVLFRALFRPKHIDFDPFLGWRKFTGTEIIVEDVKGNHNTSIAYPFVSEFTEKFNSHLNDANDARAMVPASAG